jgi:iron complex outermembrane receptor protein
MGGVINLVSRQPQDETVREVLFNQSTLGGTDGVGFFTRKFTSQWSGSLLASGHFQAKNDIDDDGWADLAGYTRGVFRPRAFWTDGAGRNGWATVGVTAESREGGLMPDDAVRLTTGRVESTDTSRVDFGGGYQFIARDRYVFNARLAGTLQHHDNFFGDVPERDRHTNVFAEASLQGASGRHTWVGGVAFERESFDPLDVPRGPSRRTTFAGTTGSRCRPARASMFTAPTARSSARACRRSSTRPAGPAASRWARASSRRRRSPKRRRPPA